MPSSLQQLGDRRLGLAGRGAHGMGWTAPVVFPDLLAGGDEAVADLAGTLAQPGRIGLPVDVEAELARLFDRDAEAVEQLLGAKLLDLAQIELRQAPAVIEIGPADRRRAVAGLRPPEGPELRTDIRVFRVGLTVEQGRQCAQADGLLADRLREAQLEIARLGKPADRALQQLLGREPAVHLARRQGTELEESRAETGVLQP